MLHVIGKFLIGLLLQDKPSCIGILEWLVVYRKAFEFGSLEFLKILGIAKYNVLGAFNFVNFLSLFV